MTYIKAKDRIGTTVNGFYIEDVKRENKHAYAYVRCPYCHHKKWMRMESVTDGKCVSCGCYNIQNNFKKPVDITGKISGRLKALEPTGERDKDNGSVIWKCECECGNIAFVSVSDFSRKQVRSCGCLLQDSRSQNGAKAAQHIKDNFCTDSTNIVAIKEKKMLKNNTSGIRGVFWSSKEQKWIAQIEFKGKNYRLGVFEKKEDAAEARKMAENEMFKPVIEQWNQNKMEEKLKVLTSKQRQIYKLYLSGKSQSKIAKELGVSCQRVSEALKSAKKRLLDLEEKKKKKPRKPEVKPRKPYNITKPTPPADLTKYANIDKTLLSEKQQRILKYRLEGKTNKEIAELENSSASAVSACVNVIKKKAEHKIKNYEDISIEPNIRKICGSYSVTTTFKGKTYYVTTAKTLDEAKKIKHEAENRKQEGTFLEWKDNIPRQRNNKSHNKFNKP
ncbi:MAG: hypothetical protein K1W23_21535 [Lachnospiraceae bacterium]